MATHLCPPTAIGWKARVSHPSKPCRATSALTGCAHSAAGQAASALHSMALLQVFQVRMFASEEAISTPCHAGRGLVGHPWCVSMGNDYGKTRLYSPIRSKTTALPRWAHHHSAQRGCPSPPWRGDESSGKWSHRNRSSSPERVRLLQPLLPRPPPKKRRRPVTYSRSQTPGLRPDEKVVQEDHFENNPLANIPRGPAHVAGSERCVLSHPGSPPSHTILEIRNRRGGISIQGPTV